MMRRLEVNVIMFLFVLNFCNEVDGGCNLSLKQDFGSSAPIYLRNGEFLAPDPKNGDIVLRRSERLLIACPGNRKYVVLGNDTMKFDSFEIKCVKDKTFRSVKTPWVGNFSEIKCNAPPWFITEGTNSCYGGNKIYRVGYKIEDTFYKLYEACFNRNILHTLYVQQKLTPSSLYIQVGGRANFIEGDVFGKTKMSKLYKVANQKERIKKIFGDGMDDKYVTKKQFINRGHLAPRADFSLLAEQRASFHYINTAPQWSKGNAGDWAALEEALRRRVNRYGSPVSVYTGAYGVLTLADNSSTHKEFYLDDDQNNNGIVPVPMYFFKVVHDPVKKSAVAFISINSSYYNSTTIKDLQFCTDICDDNPKFSWLRWRNDDTHSFCCEYEDFVKIIDVLPRLNVEELFF